MCVCVVFVHVITCTGHKVRHIEYVCMITSTGPKVRHQSVSLTAAALIAAL